MNDTTPQIVYVLTNPAMPGLVKIGKTTQADVSDRMRQLYGTGVPVPFDCAYACNVRDATEVERALHLAFGAGRVNPTREFFKTEPERVIAILRLLKVDDITTRVEASIESDVTQADKQSSQDLKRARRPRMNFRELGIPPGSILQSTEDQNVTVTVLDERTVRQNGVDCSLTAATRRVLGLEEDYPLQPSPYWTFDGRVVKDIYEEVHGDGTEA
jgi:hypothetical protein